MYINSANALNNINLLCIEGFIVLRIGNKVDQKTDIL